MSGINHLEKAKEELERAYQNDKRIDAAIEIELSKAHSLISITEELKRSNDNHALLEEMMNKAEESQTYECEGQCGKEVKNDGAYCGSCIPF